MVTLWSIGIPTCTPTGRVMPLAEPVLGEDQVARVEGAGHLELAVVQELRASVSWILNSNSEYAGDALDGVVQRDARADVVVRVDAVDEVTDEAREADLSPEHVGAGPTVWPESTVQCATVR